MQEIWKTVDRTCERYSVSNFGEVKRNAFLAENGRFCGSYYLKQANRRGYRFVTLSLGHNKHLCTSVHLLVAKAFPEICGEWFEGCEVHHKDGIPSNNNAENLICLSKEKHSKERRKDYRWEQKRVFKFNLNWELVEVLNSLSEGYKNYQKGTILQYMKKRKPYKGFYLVFDE